MHCWNCGAQLPAPDYGKISFRALCDQCDAGLHCCKNCKNYRPGLPNDCAIPGTDPISDRSANNFCEEFDLLGLPPQPKQTNIKNKFNDLFK